jgi:hypothetical protein
MGFNGFEAFQSGVEDGDGELCDLGFWGGGVGDESGWRGIGGKGRI